MALATAPKAINSRFKRLELIEIRDGIVLLVLVTMEGSVKQQMLSLPLLQEQLHRIIMAWGAKQ